MMNPTSVAATMSATGFAEKPRRSISREAIICPSTNAAATAMPKPVMEIGPSAMFSAWCTGASEASRMASKCTISARLRRAEALRPALREPKAADPRGVGRRALLVVIADVPEGAIVAGVHRERRVVLPAQCACLRCFSIHENRLAKGELAPRVVREPRGETLAGEVGRAAEPRGVGRRALLVVIADVPEGAIVAGVHRER